MISKGYVALFSAPLDKPIVRTHVKMWISSYPKLEQVCPGPHAGNTTIEIRSPDDILWETNLQFRISSDITFTWAYLSLDRRIIETSGVPDDANTLPLDILIDLPGLQEIIDQANDHRLDQLEAQGLM